MFILSDDLSDRYLYHKSNLGEFYLGSDAITHSYKNHTRKRDLINQVQKESQELFDFGACIASYILFPNKQINRKHTINQARGINRMIDDRFDLTLECIRLYYIKEKNPLQDCLYRYNDFFNLFIDFQGYVDFFLLNDLVDSNCQVKFYLPFDDFKSQAQINSKKEYLNYKKRVMEFIGARTERIKNDQKQHE